MSVTGRLLPPPVLQHRGGTEHRRGSGPRLHAVHHPRADPPEPARTAAGELITLYNLNANKHGRVNNSESIRTDNTRVYNGFEVSVNARLPQGFAFGGITTERTATNNCADLTNPNSLRFCSTHAAVPDALQGVGGLQAAVRNPAGRLVPGAAGIPIGADWTVNSATLGGAAAGRR